jgi:predicted nucleic acid-binding protein
MPHNLPLVTRNERHFDKIAGLRFEALADNRGN